MSRTIDERIVQMTFNNQEFERRANTTISTLGKLTSALDPTKLTGSLLGLNKAANAVDFSGITDSLGGIQKGLNVFEEISIGVFRRIGDAIGTYLLGGFNKVKGIVDSLTSAQISQGFNKYNDLTSSVQTLVNSTGKSVDEIDAYLKRLMWYSDETSFGFTDMTKALGTMVSAGGDIDELIPMLMGVGNAVAYAGKGASEFQRVIYNLNQSYSTGALKTMDWRSIELAGADSKVLKEQLMAAAVNLKTINKEQAKLSNFSDLVSKGKFTREVMQQAFGAFAQMTLEAEKLVNSGAFDTASEAIDSLSGRFDEFAERAFRSAQEAKSFKEAIEATQDAVSSGWMQTFQLIFGDYNESKALWTDVTNTFWEMFASGAEKRNTILSEWKAIWDQMVENPDDAGISFSQWKEISPFLTQTQAVVSAISDLVLQIRDDIAGVWSYVFPMHTTLDETGNVVKDYARTARVIFNVVENIRNTLIDLTENGLQSDVAVALRASFRALLETIKTLSIYAKAFNDSFIKPLVEKLRPVVSEIANLFRNIANIINRTAVNARQDLSPFESFLTNILNLLSPAIDLIKNVLHWVNELLSGVKGVTIFDGVFKTIGSVVQFVTNAVQGSVPVLQTLSGLLTNVFDRIRNEFTKFLEGNGSNVSKIAEGGFLAYLAVGLATVIKKFKSFDLDGIVNKFTGGNLAKNVGDVFSAIKDGIDGLLGRGGGNTSALKSMADAIMELALALVVLSLVDSSKVESSLIALGGALTEAVIALAFLGQVKGIKKTSLKALKALATAVLEISIALKIMSDMDPAALARSVLALGGVLLALAGFLAILGAISKQMQGSNVKSMAKVISKLGFALIEVALALKIMSSLDDVGLGTSLTAMGVALAEIAVFIAAVSKWTGKGTFLKLTALGPALIGVGFALIEIAAALRIMSKMDVTGSNTALVALFGAMATIAGFVVLISKFAGAGSFLAISTGMLIMAGAISVLTVALVAMSAIGWNTLKEGLKSFAALMGVFAVSGVVLGLISPLMLLAAAAMTAFGASLYVISTAMLSAVKAFAAFKLIGSDFALTIVDVLTDAFAAIVGLLPSFFLGIIEAIIGISGKLIELVSTLIQVVLTAINDNLPSIIEGLITFLSNVLEGLGNAIDILGPMLFNVAFGLLNGLITGFRENLPTLLENLFGLLIDALNGLAELIRAGGGELGAALGNLAGALIEGIFGAIGGLVGGAAEGIVGVGQGLWEGAKNLWGSLFGGDDQAEQQEESGAAIVENVTVGMEQNKQTAYDKADEIGNETAKKMEDAEEAKDSGIFTLDGLIEGLQDPAKLEELFLAGVEAGKTFMRGYNQEMDINSPSKEMEKSAIFTVQGLIQGFKDLGEVSNAGTKVGEAVYNSISSALAMASEIMDDAMNPVITPVLDLSEIQSNTGTIQGLFGNDLAYNGALSVNSLRAAAEIQNGFRNNPINVNVDFTVNNAGRDLSEADVMKFSRQIANEVDIRLGKIFRA